VNGFEQLAGLLTGKVLWAVVLAYSVFPYAALWVVVRCWPKDDDRRRQYLADYADVEWWMRPIWVGDVSIRSVLDGTAARLGATPVPDPQKELRTPLHPHHWYGSHGPIPTSPRDTVSIVRTSSRKRLAFWDDHGDEWTIMIWGDISPVVLTWDAERSRWIDLDGQPATRRRQRRAVPASDGPGAINQPFSAYDLPIHLARQRAAASARPGVAGRRR